jgi:hypothetical protein
MVRNLMLSIPVTVFGLFAGGQSASAGGFLFRSHSTCGPMHSVQAPRPQVTHHRVVHHGPIFSPAPPVVTCNPISFQLAPVCPSPVYEQSVPVQSYSSALESRINSLESKVISYEQRIQQLESMRRNNMIQ